MKVWCVNKELNLNKLPESPEGSLPIWIRIGANVPLTKVLDTIKVNYMKDLKMSATIVFGSSNEREDGDTKYSPYEKDFTGK